MRPLLRVGVAGCGRRDDAGAAHERHRPRCGAGAHRRVLRGRRAHAGVPDRARGGEACPRARPGRRHRQQLLLGDVSRRRQGLAGALRRARPRPTSRSPPTPTSWRTPTRSSCATPCSRRRELGIPASVLEVGAPADIGVPGACSGDVGEVMHKGRAAVALAPARASRPPETLITCPFEDFTDPGRAHVGPDGELQVCQGISAGNVFAGGDGPPAPEDLAAPRPGGLRPSSAPTTRSPAPSSARSSPAAPGLSPRPRATPRRASSTPTSATCATKCAPPCAPPAVTPRSSRRASVTPRTNHRRGKRCRLSAKASGTPTATP